MTVRNDFFTKKILEFFVKKYTQFIKSLHKSGIYDDICNKNVFGQYFHEKSWMFCVLFDFVGGIRKNNYFLSSTPLLDVGLWP